MPVPESHAIKTYRYLRLGMVGVIVLLLASLAIEWWKTGPRCLQPSISAYYYTPVQAVFVGAVIAIGLCMVALKGNTEGEDLLLNVGGMLAPVVALVPTPNAGSCRSVPVPVNDTAANISNNIGALIVAGLLGLAAAAAIAIKDGEIDRYLRGILAAALILAGGTAWFFAGRSTFTSMAHYTAAIALFGCIVAVVFLNAFEYREQRGGARWWRVPRNWYTVIALAMLVSFAVLLTLRFAIDWGHAVLWLEGVLIVLFAAFWVRQTAELWDEGTRVSADVDRRSVDDAVRGRHAKAAQAAQSLEKAPPAMGVTTGPDPTSPAAAAPAVEVTQGEPPAQPVAASGRMDD